MEDAGRIGFSFPIWRWFSVSYGSTPCLFQSFGLQQIRRSSDRDSSGHDTMGSGFFVKMPEFSVEFRRSYILVCSGQVSIIIRNSSYYFGRSALSHPVYVRLSNTEQLDDISGNTIEECGFKPFHLHATELSVFSLDITKVLEQFRILNLSIMNSLLNPHGAHYNTFLHWKDAHLSSGTKSPVFYSWIDPRLPPWFPIQSSRLGEAFGKPIAHLLPVLLSSENGDLPA